MSQHVEPGTSPVVEPDERTRDRVLTAVLEQGPVSAAQLGALLGLTPAAVRRHLDSLTREGLIEVKLISNAKSGAGRPARRYVVSRRGQTEIGDDYLEIAKLALQEIAGTHGEIGVVEFARRRFAKMEAKYQPIVDAAGTDVAARSKALATALNNDRFVATSNSLNAGTAMAAEQLCQGHCPIQELATSFPDFCDAETDVFARLIGVDVRRLSTMASGGHVCTTHVPTGRAVVRKLATAPSYTAPQGAMPQGTTQTTPAPRRIMRSSSVQSRSAPATTVTAGKQRPSNQISNHQQERP
ncbi:helix-turn-helix transcriptional regulator [Arthrobacter antibioticus]|uniref:helix-turn-helix transcriptional regulator n=1 Tax=Arthrobacter sp. H35-MC1 TaxID=3046203 RepID=UPI0024BB4BC0|nr:helix-turn-helix domain-containing protein [Arthrobacter sp. H35-MC1]MDJ0315691.1 winged helix-turn-helix transcriptional regulator [Arthrobacter sp. H35-MC1]